MLIAWAHGCAWLGNGCDIGIVGAGCASLAIGMVICNREQGLCSPGDWHRSGIGSTDGAFIAYFMGSARGRFTPTVTPYPAPLTK